MKRLLCSLVLTPLLASTASAESKQPQSLGALEFGDDGILFAADAKGAAVFALEVGGGEQQGKALKVEKLGEKIAALLDS